MTYEYICTACGHQWEAEHPISAPPLRDCPKCGKASAKRQVSGGTGFLLKGGGWYADGYGLKSSTSEKSSSPAKATEAASTTAGKESASTTSSAAASTSKDTTTAAPSTKSSSGASD